MASLLDAIAGFQSALSVQDKSAKRGGQPSETDADADNGYDEALPVHVVSMAYRVPFHVPFSEFME